MATVVAFAGEWDVASQKSFRREVRRLDEESVLILDFSEVAYVDSSCLAELIVMERKRSESG
ncbi:MAG: STAS domain-containing protein, partial [Candidatus Eremiobacteraeota bacterium]|nr:STAS domain-containing protein [Candidatus Eremiobacteraeota bacterium]